mmetsp:Transcript_17434/g.45546  ORF Transcript_17434/g.45546 Transcript_17434/m.45546 type:complete len:214 (-) Transcript_17434:546-1187(-)
MLFAGQDVRTGSISIKTCARLALVSGCTMMLILSNTVGIVFPDPPARPPRFVDSPYASNRRGMPCAAGEPTSVIRADPAILHESRIKSIDRMSFVCMLPSESMVAVAEAPVAKVPLFATAIILATEVRAGTATDGSQATCADPGGGTICENSLKVPLPLAAPTDSSVIEYCGTAPEHPHSPVFGSTFSTVQSGPGLIHSIVRPLRPGTFDEYS